MNKFKTMKPLNCEESKKIRDQFYMDWLQSTGYEKISTEGFQRLVSDLEKMLGEMFLNADMNRYQISRKDDWDGLE